MLSMALNSIGNSVGNKLKCTPKISKMPPIFFNPSEIVPLAGVRFGVCDFHR
jgi:hypothetical protein